jgi:hypothetical protein
MKLFIDSFGPEVVTRIAVVFTRAGVKTPEQAVARATAMAATLRKLTGIPVATFPVFQIDAGVATDPRFSPEYRLDRVEKNARAFDALAMWVRTQTPIPTADFKIGEYAETKRIREAQEREATEKKRADEEAVARATAEQRARDAEADAEAARNEGNSLFDDVFGAVIKAASAVNAVAGAVGAIKKL